MNKYGTIVDPAQFCLDLGIKKEIVDNSDIPVNGVCNECGRSIVGVVDLILWSFVLYVRTYRKKPAMIVFAQNTWQELQNVLQLKRHIAEGMTEEDVFKMYGLNAIWGLHYSISNTIRDGVYMTDIINNDGSYFLYTVIDNDEASRRKDDAM